MMKTTITATLQGSTEALSEFEHAWLEGHVLRYETSAGPVVVLVTECAEFEQG